MAPSTACSASLLQGAWRPAYSAGCSVEETAGDADVSPGRLLPNGVAQQGCGMVGDDDRYAPEPMDLVPQAPDRLLRVEKRLRRGAPHPPAPRPVRRCVARRTAGTSCTRAPARRWRRVTSPAAGDRS